MSFFRGLVAAVFVGFSFPPPPQFYFIALPSSRPVPTI